MQWKWLVGIGTCVDATNNANCSFDGGDCCGTNVTTTFCQDCICHEDLNCNASLELIGNGYCNDETNNVHCYYDGLDCCRSSSNTEVCSECSCHGELMIMQICFSFLIRAKPS